MLGLAKKRVDLFGGSVRVESEPGKGPRYGVATDEGKKGIDHLKPRIGKIADVARQNLLPFKRDILAHQGRMPYEIDKRRLGVREPLILGTRNHDHR